MEESFSFLELGPMPEFDELRAAVLSFSEKDWVEYINRKSGIAAENSQTIPLLHDPRQSAIIEHARYRQFKHHIERVYEITAQHLGCSAVRQAMFARMMPHANIPKHRDKGPMTAKCHRVHVPVFTNQQCLFSVAEETRHMTEGNIWVIDNVGKYHSVVNAGSTERIHLIIDILA
ncbi:MAG: aspartyl/asparaginyl beta-hydroxylase domain-containing protein [Actinobacteria bacterium]|jgi:aspartyl/asparaginyl beta-hydroxylase (cupin superfamily)|nr:aspartyl/asparaginyl beta-hydroxylase domain-containing protein [Actinomycetota bacterium]